MDPPRLQTHQVGYEHTIAVIVGKKPSQLERIHWWMSCSKFES
jgi:hypothetical protein